MLSRSLPTWQRIAAGGLSAAAAVALALVAAAPAYAATGKIDQVTPNGGGRVTVLFGAVAWPRGRASTQSR